MKCDIIMKYYGKGGKFMKKTLLTIFLIAFIILVILINIASQNNSWENNQNESLKSNIEVGLESANIDTSDITSIEKINDWQEGPRYRIICSGKQYIVYSYDDNQVVSIRDNNSNTIYENKNLKIADAEDSDAIILKYDELGDYGKEDTFDGQKYIRYYIPKGKYEVKSLVKNSQFFIEGKKIYKNSSGYDESKTIDNISISKGETKEISIDSNSCISLTINSNISLTKK